MKMKDLQITINETLKKLEEAQEMLSSVFQTVIDEPSSVVEKEPAVDQTKEPFTETEQKDYREDLLCPHCESLVYDNRSKKQSKEYSPSGSPDFKCSNNKDCPAFNKQTGFAKGWWLNSKDLPTGWISTAEQTKDHQTNDVTESPF